MHGCSNNNMHGCSNNACYMEDKHTVDSSFCGDIWFDRDCVFISHVKKIPLKWGKAITMWLENQTSLSNN